MPIFKRIDRKLLFWFLIITILLLGIVAFIAYNSGMNIIKKQTFDYCRRTAIALEGHIGTFIKAQKNIARDFASDRIILQSLKELSLPHPNPDEIINRLRTHVQFNKISLYSPNILGISVLDCSGRVVFSTDKEKEGKDESGEDYFLMVKRDGYFGDIHYSETYYEPVIEVSAPIIDKEAEEFLGVIVNIISGSMLADITRSHWIGEYDHTKGRDLMGAYFYGGLLRDHNAESDGILNSNSSGDVYIVNGDKKMITMSRFVDNAVLNQVVDTKPVQMALTNGEEMVGIYPDYRGVSIIGASVFIEELRWIILAEKDKSKTFALLFRLKAQMITLGIAALVVVIFVSSLISKKIAAPIKAMIKATQKRAEGDMDYRLERISDDEVGILTDSFNKMCDDVAKITVSREFMDKVFIGINESLIITDLWLNIKKVNQAAVNLLGYSEPEMINKPVSMIFEESDGFLDSVGLQELIKHDCGLNDLEVMYKSKSGAKVPVKLSASVVKDCAHKKHYGDCPRYKRLLSCGFCKAINVIIVGSDMRRLNALIMEEKERVYELSTIQEISRQLGYTLNYNDLFRFILNSLHKSINFNIAGSVFCKGSDDLIYIKRMQQIDDSLLDWYKDNLEKTFAKLSVNGHKKCKREVIDITMDHTEHSSEQVAAAPCSVDGGKGEMIRSYFNVPLIVKKQIVGIINISSFKENAFMANHIRMLYTIANQLTVSIQHLITLIDHEKGKMTSILRDMVDGVIMVDCKGIIEMVNPAGERMLRFLSSSREEELLVHLGDYKLKEPLGLILNNKEMYISHELSFSRDFQQITISIIIAPIKDEGQNIGAVIVLRDISKEYNLQQRLLHAEKLSAIGEMVAGIAHEINNPLAGIMGLTQLLQIQPDLPASAIKNVDKILSYTDRARRIVQGMLTFARAHKPEKALVNINQIIEQVMEMVEYNIKTSDIRIVKDMSLALPETITDIHQMQQVFFNIINNACQAMAQYNGERILTIKTRKNGNNIEISFHNTGHGIPRDIIKKIFNPFFTTKDVGKGTGMGLSIAYGIVEEHQGVIYAVSNEMEGIQYPGVTFFVELPIKEITSDSAAKTGIDNKAAPTFRCNFSMNILIVDDEIPVAESISSLLAADGNSCETAASVDEALKKIAVNDYDLIISDIKMPGIDGREFYFYLRLHKPRLAERFVVITGDVMNEETKSFLDENDIPCIAKPFTYEELKKKISGVIGSWE